MELKNWQKLHLGAELRMCKEYVLAIKYCIWAIILISFINFIDLTIINPHISFFGWLLILCVAYAIYSAHSNILKIIEYMLSVLEAYETYQKKRDEIENRNNFKP